MESNTKVKRTAVPTQDPDSEGEEKAAGEVELEERESLKRKSNVPLNFDAEKVSTFAVTKLDKSTKSIVFPAFAITAFVSAVLVILCFFNVTNDLLGLIIIMVLTICTAYIAMYGVYKWGAVDEWIEYHQKQNQQYKENTEELKGTRENLKSQVKEMEGNVDNLQEEGVELNQTIKKFDELKQALESVKCDNEEVMDLVDGLNQRYHDIRLLANRKDQTQLLLFYYKMQFGGVNRNRFEREDYERFIGRLNDSTRELYSDFGGFDALDVNKDGNVDPEEFMSMTEKILQRTETAFVELEKAKTLSMSMRRSMRKR